MKQPINAEKGFSLIHVLPMVAIIAVVAVIGVKVLNRSHALIGGDTINLFTCSASFGWRNPTTGGVDYAITLSNSSSVSTQPARTLYIRKYEYQTIAGTINVGSLGPKKKATYYGTVFPGSGVYTLVATWKTSANSGSCGGSRRIT